MSKHTRLMSGLVAASLLVLSASADAQGKGNDKNKDHDKKNKAAKVVDAGGKVDHDRDRDHDRNRGDVIAGRRDDNHDRNKVRKVPPGLAKKPGQMPPGQYKKRYETTQGATVLGDILRRRGYTVVGTTQSGTSQIVDYRMPDGTVRRVTVSQGPERLAFGNLPADLLREVLARLY